MRTQNVKETKAAKVKKALKLWSSNIYEKDAPVIGPLKRQKAIDLSVKMGKSRFCCKGWLASALGKI